MPYVEDVLAEMELTRDSLQRGLKAAAQDAGIGDTESLLKQMVERCRRGVSRLQHAQALAEEMLDDITRRNEP